MNLRQILLALVVVDFLAVTAWAVSVHGLLGFFETVFSTPAGIAVATDLCLALAVAVGWTWRDAQARGERGWPWLLATALFGSAAPLSYLVRRLGRG